VAYVASLLAVHACVVYWATTDTWHCVHGEHLAVPPSENVTLDVHGTHVPP
jgi:hypothetical protein